MIQGFIGLCIAREVFMVIFKGFLGSRVSFPFLLKKTPAHKGSKGAAGNSGSIPEAMSTLNSQYGVKVGFED